MITQETDAEKRQYKRYDISSGAFALLKWNGSEVLGSIKDISAGGLSLAHINENEDLKDLSKVTINLISEKICRENFAGRNIWSTNEENGFSMAMVKMKRRGIEFQGLSSNMQLQLEEFISSLIKK